MSEQQRKKRKIEKKMPHLGTGIIFLWRETVGPLVEGGAREGVRP